MPIALTRAELYARVWSEPVQKLSAEFGISGPGLAKLCRRHNIPVPPRGHWAKKAAGKRIRQPPLPGRPQGRPDRITFPGSAPKPEGDDQPPVHPLIVAEADAAQAIIVSERLQVRHPLLRQMREYWRGSRQPHWARQVPLPPRLEINVGREQESRVLRLLQALFAALARRGYEVSRAEDGRIKVVVLDESCHLTTRERQRQVKNAAPSSSGSSILPAPRLQVVGSGELEVRIERAFHRRTVADGKRGRLETRLNEVVVVLLESALAEKADRAAREVAHRAELERQRRAEEARERRRQERARVTHLEQLADAADRHQRLRAFARALRETVGEVPAAGAFGRWLDWVDRHVSAGDVLEHFRAHGRTVTLFYCANPYDASEVVRRGFTDARPGYGDDQELPAAVELADVPLERTYGGTVVVEVTLTEGDALPYESLGVERDWRTFRIPAAILNQYPRAIRQ
jgi:hypothetical protein